METKHTKTEWEYFVSKKNNISVRIGSRVIELGHIYDDDCGNDKCCRVEEHANAKLIAAAPDLLEALQEMLSRFRGNDIGMIKAEYVKEKALRAIEKATT